MSINPSYYRTFTITSEKIQSRGRKLKVTMSSPYGQVSMAPKGTEIKSLKEVESYVREPLSESFLDSISDD